MVPVPADQDSITEAGPPTPVRSVGVPGLSEVGVSSPSLSKATVWAVHVEVFVHSSSSAAFPEFGSYVMLAKHFPSEVSVTSTTS